MDLFLIIAFVLIIHGLGFVHGFVSSRKDLIFNYLSSLFLLSIFFLILAVILKSMRL